MDVTTHRRKSKGKHSSHIRSTWQQFCISDLPSACQYSSSCNIAKKHKNKLFAITPVPMGTGPQRVCPLRHSSAQTARKPTSQHAAQTRRGARETGESAAQPSPPPPPGLFLPEPGPPTEPWYQCKRLAGPRL